jgi:hypothetical protein
MSTGLRANVRELLITPMLAFERWFKTSLFNRDASLPSARMAARGVLGIGINALSAIGVPRPSATVPPPVSTQQLAKNATYSAGSFMPFQWIITLPSDLADAIATPLGVEGIATSIDVDPKDVVRYVLAEYANTVSHECRHCEQVYRIAQWAFLSEREKGVNLFDGFLRIYEEKFMSSKSAMRKPASPPNLQKAVRAAILSVDSGADLGLGTGSEARAEAFLWYQSMYGDMSKLYQQRRDATNIAAYREIPEEQDAYAIGELVRECLLDEWHLKLANQPNLLMQHTNLIDAS